MTAITPASNQYANALSTGMAALTPGSIMLLLRRRMGDMDGQIDSIMTEIESNTAASEKIQERVEVLTAIKSAMANQEPDGSKSLRLENIEVTWDGETTTANELLRRFDINIDVNRTGKTTEELQGSVTHADAQIAALEGLPEEAPHRTLLPGLRQRRENLQHHLEYSENAYGSDTITGSSLAASIEQMQSEGRRMNSGNEVLMIQIQSGMQQRAQAVTMATQMLKSINDSSNSIAQNIGR